MTNNTLTNEFIALNSLTPSISLLESNLVEIKEAVITKLSINYLEKFKLIKELESKYARKLIDFVAEYYGLAKFKYPITLQDLEKDMYEKFLKFIPQNLDCHLIVSEFIMTFPLIEGQILREDALKWFKKTGIDACFLPKLYEENANNTVQLKPILHIHWELYKIFAEAKYFNMNQISTELVLNNRSVLCARVIDEVVLIEDGAFKPLQDLDIESLKMNLPNLLKLVNYKLELLPEKLLPEYINLLKLNFSFELYIALIKFSPLLNQGELTEILHGIMAKLSKNNLIEIFSQSLIRGFDSLVKSILQKYNDFSTIKFECNDTPLHIAAALGHTKIGHELLKMGVDPNLSNDREATPGYLAAQEGHGDFLLELIKVGADLNKAQDTGATPAFIASANGHAHVIKILAQSGVDLYKPTKNNNTAAYIAVCGGHALVLKELRAAGVNLTISKVGLNLAHIAAQRSNAQKVLNELYLAGIDLNKHSEQDGSTAAHFAALYQKPENLAQLAKMGANLDLPNSLDETPLHIAAQNGYADVISELVKLKVDLNKVSFNGETALYIAAACDHSAAVNELVIAGADINIPKGRGATPVFIATANGNLESLTILLKAGADLNKPSFAGVYPAYIAAYKGHSHIMRLLVQFKADLNKTKNGLTPAHAAALKGHAHTIAELSKAGADLTNSINGITPAHLAIMHGHIPVLIELIISECKDLINHNLRPLINTTNRQAIIDRFLALYENEGVKIFAMQNIKSNNTYLSQFLLEVPQIKRLFLYTGVLDLCETIDQTHCEVSYAKKLELNIKNSLRHNYEDKTIETLLCKRVLSSTLQNCTKNFTNPNGVCQNILKLISEHLLKFNLLTEPGKRSIPLPFFSRANNRQEHPSQEKQNLSNSS